MIARMKGRALECGFQPVPPAGWPNDCRERGVPTSRRHTSHLPYKPVAAGELHDLSSLVNCSALAIDPHVAGGRVPHSYASEQTVVLPLVVHVHGWVTVQPFGIGLQGCGSDADARRAPAAIVMSVHRQSNAFFIGGFLRAGAAGFAADGVNYVSARMETRFSAERARCFQSLAEFRPDKPTRRPSTLPVSPEIAPQCFR